MKRNYPLLLASQYLSAFGNNVILSVIIGQLTLLQQRGLITDAQNNAQNAIYNFVFFIPSVLLGPLAGYLNDRFAKTRWLLGGNLIKLTGTLVAALALWWGDAWQQAGYAIVGIGACIYSPAKYGILPEILPGERLVKANGTVELLTLVAILSGKICGASLIDHLPVATCYGIVLGIYVVSLAFNLAMQITPSHAGVRLAPSLQEFGRSLRDLLVSPRLARVLIGTGLFWFAGAVLRTNFQPWGLSVLHFTSNTQIALLLLWLTLGIMVGSVLAGQFYPVGDLRAVRRNGVGLALGVALLACVEFVPALGTGGGRAVVIAILIVTGIMAGLFLVPLNATLQAESDPARLGKTIACQNFVDHLGMSLGAAFVLVAAKSGLGTSGIFLALAVALGLILVGLRVPPRPAPAVSAP